MQALGTRHNAGRLAVIVLVVAVTAAVGTVGIWGAYANDQPSGDRLELADAMAQVLFGTSFVIGGLVAWWSRPDNATGRLMAGTGLLFAAGSWQGVDDGWLMVAGAIASLAAVATFLHLILAFPAGRVTHQADRWVVGLAYAVVAGVALAVPFVQPNEVDCDGCADNPLAAAPNDTVTAIVIGLANVAIGVCVIALLALTWRRYRRATPALRRTMAPLLGTASLAALLALVSIPASLGPDALQLAVGICFATVMTLVPVAFLIGLLRDRLQRTTSIQGLVIRLAGAADHEQLRSILAEALRDPELTIAFWFPERETYVDPQGQPVEVPEQGVTVVERDGEPIARLLHDPALDEDPVLLETVAAAAAIGLERARLEAELRARLDELRASRARIVETAYHARRRLERDLHDGAQQRLVALSLTLRMIRSRVGGDEATSALVDGASTELAAALASCASWPAASTRRSSPTAAWSRRCRRSPTARRCPSSSTCRPTSACRRRTRPRSTSWPSEALANVAKYAGGTGASVARVGRGGRRRRSRSPTTARAAPTPGRARASSRPARPRRGDGRALRRRQPGRRRHAGAGDAAGRAARSHACAEVPAPTASA